MFIFCKKDPLQTHFFIFGFFSIIIILLVIHIYSKNVFSFDAVITWDENEEEDIAGYKIFCREEHQSYNYDIPVWIGSGITCAIYNLDDKKTYYFVARALNTSGIESKDSDELRVELIDGEIIVNASNDSYSFVGNGCFITTGDRGL